jgi:hypothetical protein
VAASKTGREGVCFKAWIFLSGAFSFFKGGWIRDIEAQFRFASLCNGHLSI